MNELSNEMLEEIDGGGKASTAALCVTGAALMVVAAPAAAAATFASIWTTGAGLALSGSCS